MRGVWIFLGWVLISFSVLAADEDLKTTTAIKVEIKGIEEAEIVKNILASLRIEQQKNNERLTKKRIKRLHKKAPEDIQIALRPFGYYRPQVDSELTAPEAAKTIWTATYTIDLGDPLILKTVDVELQGEAKKDKIFARLLAKFPVKQGDIFNSPNYEKGKRVLRNLAESRGYFDANFLTTQILLDESDYSANVKLVFDSGKRYKFGAIQYEQDTFKESLLDRYKTFEVGDAYNEDTMLAFRTALVNSQYFDDVDVRIQRPDNKQAKKNYDIPVTVKLAPRKRNLYNASIGYGTDTGIRGGLGWERRYINSYGHSFKFDLQLSEIRQAATAQYLIPVGDDENQYLTAKAGYLKEENDIYDTESLIVGLSKNQIRTVFNNIKLQEVIGIEYRDEKYQIGEDTGHATLLMPNASWSFIKADDRIYTLNGYKLDFSIRGALNNLGSDNSFIQPHLSGKYIHQVFEKGRFITRGEWGYTSVSLLDGEFRDLPPSIRYFAGGDKSVRGYDYNALGPQDTKGNVIGGKNLIVGSAEYEHQIVGKWSAAVFYDVGNAFNDFSEALQHGVGVGVRWRSPIGLIRVDVATALNDDNYPVRLHINIGPDL
ncbi:autotransporter assembly complex family protein [Candidatus Albibeggiatoa sp. nov. BB20]|uniref:autotransporter assembly complex protein TamA n=1 Tax=Candidatus Albibeggiatoa sp. nov. BB20 TaxID=3162723 RepID=UPI0033654F5A